MHRWTCRPVLINLTVSTEGESIVLFPDLSATRFGIVVKMTFVDTTGFLSSSCKSTRFTVLENKLVLRIE